MFISYYEPNLTTKFFINLDAVASFSYKSAIYRHNGQSFLTLTLTSGSEFNFYSDLADQIYIKLCDYNVYHFPFEESYDEREGFNLICDSAKQLLDKEFSSCKK